MSIANYVPGQPQSRTVLANPDPRSWLPATMYLVFAIADLLFSLIAFRCGVAEGNPFMASLLAHGLFIPGKLILTVLVTVLMVVVYSAMPRRRWIVWSGVFLMAIVVSYHVWALPRIVGLPLFAMS